MFAIASNRLAAFAGALFLAACFGPTFVVQQYAGPQRPPETIAVLRANGGEPVRLLVLDDEDIAAPIVEDGRLHIEMLPARHTLSVGNAKAPNERYLPLAFQAEAGRVYRVAFVAQGGTTIPRVFDVDRASDRTLRDVTLTTEAPISPPRHLRLPPEALDAGPNAEPRASGPLGSLMPRDGGP